MKPQKNILKILVVWSLATLLAYGAFQWFETHPARTKFQVTGTTVHIERGTDGHYHWPGSLNGQAIEFLVDTGATRTAVPLKMAEQLQLEPLSEVQSSTAGGIVIGQLMRANIVLQGGVKITGLHVVALPGLAHQPPLLGMDVLARLRWQQHQGILSFDLREHNNSEQQ
jgi:aspartyl protease family protein